jgi:hypothetical protein
MSDKEPQQTPTPEKTPQQKRPGPPSRSNSEASVAGSEEDQGYQSRSRSQSRRRRRQNQRQRAAQGKAQAGNVQAESMAAIDEQPEEQQGDQPHWLKNPETRETTEVQPFERIPPPSEAMMGPVTYAKMMRGEIPWRGPPPTQPYSTTQGVDAKTSGPDPMDQDGLKLRLELNLDIEIELKASIHGDLTLALM